MWTSPQKIYSKGVICKKSDNKGVKDVFWSFGRFSYRNTIFGRFCIGWKTPFSAFCSGSGSLWDLSFLGWSAGGLLMLHWFKKTP
jgi:hypothetical protein